MQANLASLIRSDLGYRGHGVTMTTSIPGYPLGGKSQLKGTVISLAHTVFILSSGPCSSTILWEESGREGEKEMSIIYLFFSVFSVGEDH